MPKHRRTNTTSFNSLEPDLKKRRVKQESESEYEPSSSEEENDSDEDWDASTAATTAQWSESEETEEEAPPARSKASKKRPVLSQSKANKRSNTTRTKIIEARPVPFQADTKVQQKGKEKAGIPATVAMKKQNLKEDIIPFPKAKRDKQNYSKNFSENKNFLLIETSFSELNIETIRKKSGGYSALEGVVKNYKSLRAHFDDDMIFHIAAQDAGRLNIETAINHTPTLLNLGFQIDEIYNLLNFSSAWRSVIILIEEVKHYNYPDNQIPDLTRQALVDLLHRMNYKRTELSWNKAYGQLFLQVRAFAQEGQAVPPGFLGLNTIQARIKSTYSEADTIRFLKEKQFTENHLDKITQCRGRNLAFQKLHQVYEEANQFFTHDQMVEIVSLNSGHHRLELMIRLYPQLARAGFKAKHCVLLFNTNRFNKAKIDQFCLELPDYIDPAKGKVPSLVRFELIKLFRFNLYPHKVDNPSEIHWVRDEDAYERLKPQTALTKDKETDSSPPILNEAANSLTGNQKSQSILTQYEAVSHRMVQHFNAVKKISSGKQKKIIDFLRANEYSETAIDALRKTNHAAFVFPIIYLYHDDLTAMGFSQKEITLIGLTYRYGHLHLRYAGQRGSLLRDLGFTPAEIIKLLHFPHAIKILEKFIEEIDTLIPEGENCLPSNIRCQIVEFFEVIGNPHWQKQYPKIWANLLSESKEEEETINDLIVEGSYTKMRAHPSSFEIKSAKENCEANRKILVENNFCASRLNTLDAHKNRALIFAALVAHYPTLKTILLPHHLMFIAKWYSGPNTLKTLASCYPALRAAGFKKYELFKLCNFSFAWFSLQHLTLNLDKFIPPGQTKIPKATRTALRKELCKITILGIKGWFETIAQNEFIALQSNADEIAEGPIQERSVDLKEEEEFLESEGEADFRAEERSRQVDNCILDSEEEEEFLENEGEADFPAVKRGRQVDGYSLNSEEEEEEEFFEPEGEPPAEERGRQTENHRPPSDSTLDQAVDLSFSSMESLLESTLADIPLDLPSPLDSSTQRTEQKEDDPEDNLDSSATTKLAYSPSFFNRTAHARRIAPSRETKDFSALLHEIEGEKEQVSTTNLPKAASYSTFFAALQNPQLRAKNTESASKGPITLFTLFQKTTNSDGVSFSF